MIPAPLIGALPYVVAAVVAVAALIGAHEVGFGRAERIGKAALQAFQAEAEKQAAELRAQAAEVKERVVIEYRDRVQVIREVPPEVIREVEVIRNSGCTLPAEFRWLHDNATGSQAPEAGSSADPSTPIDCATAIETIRENYARARENAAQLEALQKWAESVSSP